MRSVENDTYYKEKNILSTSIKCVLKLDSKEKKNNNYHKTYCRKDECCLLLLSGSLFLRRSKSWYNNNYYNYRARATCSGQRDLTALFQREYACGRSLLSGLQHDSHRCCVFALTAFERSSAAKVAKHGAATYD